MRADRLGGSGGLFRLCRSQRRPAAGLLPGHRRRRGAVDRHVSVAAKLQRAGVSPPGAADVSRRRRMDAGVPDRLRRDVLSQARRPRVARLDGRMVRARALRARARACAPLALRGQARALRAVAAARRHRRRRTDRRRIAARALQERRAGGAPARRLRRPRRRSLARHGRGLSQARQRRRSRRVRALDAHRSGDLRAADHRRRAHSADAAQALGAADRHPPRGARQPPALPSALLFLHRRGAGARRLRQADRRLGRRHQAGVRQDRRRAGA